MNTLQFTNKYFHHIYLMEYLLLVQHLLLHLRKVPEAISE